MDSPLERRIKTYAFTHNCDLDEAFYKVIKEVSSELSMTTKKEGLYDRYFGTEETDNGQRS